MHMKAVKNRIESYDPAQTVAKAFWALTTIPSGHPLYRRINILLEACRAALGACDARCVGISPAM